MNEDDVNREDAELVDVFVIGEHKFPNNLKDDLRIDEDLNTSFEEHPEKFAWYATAYELALDQELRLKEELQRMYARLDHKARQEAKQAGQKLTEKMVENTVITHPKYTELQDNYLEAKRNTGLLKAAKDAMIHRKDMLIQRGSTYRAEGQSGISVKEQYYKENFG